VETSGTVSTDAGENSKQGSGAKALAAGASENDSTSSQVSGSQSSSSGKSDAKFDDAMFVREASKAGMAEVRMGQLAQQKGTDQHLKDMGQRLVDDHTKANQELTQIASQKGLQMTTTLSAKENTKIEKLEQANGQEFDNMFNKENLTAHEKAVKLFRTAKTSLKDPELRAFAEKTLPTLEEHLKMAKEMKGQSGTAGSTSDTAK
jgi:putative membrane protein